MARKPSSNPLAEHVQRLEEQQAQLMREMAIAEKELRRKPKAARPTPSPERKIRLNNNAVAVDLPQPMEHRWIGGNSRQRSRRGKRRTRTAVRLDQIRFILLCFVLLALVLFVWRNFLS